MKTANSNDKFIVDEKFIRTKRANELMKVAQSMMQTVYVCGATGYGKTSFVVDFLKRKHYGYFSANSCLASDIEVWFKKNQNQEAIIVIDDLHVLSSAEDREAYYAILQTLISSRNIWVIMIARCMIPSWIMPLYIQKIFTIIKEEDLSFTDQNLQEYLNKWEITLLPTTEDLLKEVAKGFPLFCRIAALRLQLIAHTTTKAEERSKAEIRAISDARKDWWDYLDGYVFDQWDVSLQEFVMELSIVDRFDIQLAQIITKRSDASVLLSVATETGNYVMEYTEGDEVFYEFREPVRYAMRRRLQKRYSERRIDELYYNAGSCYEYQDKVLEALQMYEKGHNEEGISNLLIRNSRKHAGAGHYWELREYYKALPEEVIKQNVELMAAVSMLHSILMDDEKSDYWYHELEEYAKTHSGSERRLAQAKLLNLDIALPQRGTVKMVDILKNAGTILTNKGYILPEMSVTNNQPTVMQGGKDFCEWSKRDRVLAKSIGKLIEFVLSKSSKGLVNIALAESQFEKGGDSYEISTLAGKGRVQAESNGLYEQQFVAVAILAQLEAQNGQMEDAIESLQSFRKSIPADKPQLCAGVDSMKVRLLLYNGSSDEITSWFMKAPDEDKEFCTLERFHYITKVRVYIAMGKLVKAMQLLVKLQYFADLRQRIYLQIETGILMAIVQYRLEDSVWKETLQKAITHAEEFHFVRILTREGAALWELLKNNEFAWEDEDFKKQVYEECSELADTYPAYLKVKQSGNIVLSEMEIKVLRMQAEGMSVEKIADALGLSKAGVKYYNQQTYKKLGVNSKAQAVNEAKNRKLI